MTNNLRDAILQHVANSNYHPVKPTVIAKKLGLTGARIQDLKMTIKRMVKSGELAWGPSHLVYPAAKVKQVPKTEPKRAPKPDVEVDVERPAKLKKEAAKKAAARDSKHFTGTFRRAAGGFGFVRPEGTQRAEG